MPKTAFLFARQGARFAGLGREPANAAGKVPGSLIKRLDSGVKATNIQNCSSSEAAAAVLAAL